MDEAGIVVPMRKHPGSFAEECLPPYEVSIPKEESLEKATSTEAGSNRFPLDWLRSIRISMRPCVEYTLLGLVCLTCSIPYKISIGTFSIFPIEIAVFAYLIWRGVWGKHMQLPIQNREKRIGALLIIFVALGGVIWSVALNWRDRTDLLWGWIWAVLFLFALLDSARQQELNWRVVAALFVLFALPNAIAGLQQLLVGVDGRGKSWLGWSKHISLVPISGLFGYSNEMAIYQYWPVVLSLGLALSTKRWAKALFSLLALLYFAVLYFAMMRTTIVSFGIAGVLCVLLLVIKKRKYFLALLGGAVLTALPLALLALPFLSPRVFSGRANLWLRTIRLIVKDPLRLPLGYIARGAYGRSPFWLPHNIFLYAWMYAGWIGVFLLTALAVYFIVDGWRHYAQIRQLPFLAVLWAGLGCMLIVNGIATLYLHEVYHILTFVLVFAIWLMVRRDIVEEMGATAMDTESDHALRTRLAKWGRWCLDRLTARNPIADRPHE
jgi:hypothetical protein